MEFYKDQFLISTEVSRLDVPMIFDFLSHMSYWAAGRPLETVQRSIEHSLPFGVYDTAGGRQIGFARVITDYATFAYIADVFILPEYRGKGLGKWLMASIMAHPDLQGFRRWMLATQDAHELYRQVGFSELSHPEWMMEIFGK